MLPADAQPLVSCIMPTSNRRRYVPQAIRYFRAQDYPYKELVILDDGTESVGDLVPDDPQVRYIRLGGKRTLGAKRNECVVASRGDLVMHWDDDDWMASYRITYQVQALLRAGAELCGLRRMLFYELVTGVSWLYAYPDGQRPWLAGGSLLYTRDFWQRAPFPDIQVGSDTRFVWNRRLDRAVVLPDYRFYVALIHPGNTSPKHRRGPYWARWTGELQQIMGADLRFYRSISQAGRGDATAAAVGTPAHPKPTTVLTQSAGLDAKEPTMRDRPPTYSIIMVVHNTHAMTQMATLRTLRHIAGHDARLIVVDNASTDGAAEWLALLAQRGDIDLIRNASNIGHGPAIELARRAISSPYLVTLDSDAFPLADDWLPRLRSYLQGRVRVAGIRHNRDYIHPSCLMIARQTLEEFNLSFLNEKDRPSQLDVAERISLEIKRRGYQIAGLERTRAQRRGSAAEPVFLGSEYEGVVYHQWYTTRAAIAGGLQVDDVPTEAIERSLHEVFERYHAEIRDLTVVIGMRAMPGEAQRRRNAVACLRALNLQDLPRWRYRIIVVEQDRTSQLEATLAPLADRYLFAYNAGPYNRGWAFNIGAALPASRAGVLCLIDADILVPPDFLRQGLEAVQAGRPAVLPYSEVIYLNAASTERAIKDRLAAPRAVLNAHDYHGQVFTTSQGGCMWVDAALYHQLGGHDERFRGWGREDREFWDRLARATPIARLPGTLFHLDHPRPAMEDAWALANQALYERLSTAPTMKPTRPIGDLGLYSHEKERVVPATPSPLLGRREWENWHRWDDARIEQIVHDERRRTRATSSRRRLAEILVRLGDSLLDVGCGPGALWPHLEPYRPRFSWAGVDVTHEMVSTARRLFPYAPVHHADAGSLPFDRGHFDIVLLRHVLEHLPPVLMEATLNEAMRVARRTVAVDFYRSPVTRGPRQTRRVGENFLEIQWTVAELEVLIAKAGWLVRGRQAIAGDPGETDVLWILAPQRGHAKPVHASAASPRLEQLKISIIMPTYHRPHTIFRTVAMIQAQTYRNWELIIIDNAGDTDLRFDDARIRVYRHADRPSASYARNWGVRYATGDLVCFFDDDDDMFPTYLERFAAAFQANPGAKMVRCGMIVTRGATNFSYATPECCLRREFATPSWVGNHSAQDQLYFSSIIAVNGWSQTKGDIVVIHEALCRANANARGGLRSGCY